MAPYRIIVCRNGFCSQMENGLFSAACTITLVYGTFNILFDPGGPWDGEFVLSSLAKHGLKSEDIDFVICSHGHVDHIGNLNQFPKATIIVGTEIMRHDGIVEHNFSEANPFVIDENACYVILTLFFLGSCNMCSRTHSQRCCFGSRASA